MRTNHNFYPFKLLYATLVILACSICGGQASLEIDQTRQSLRHRSLCDESLFFPEYTPSTPEFTSHWQNPDGPRFVAIPNDPTGRSYAPLCPDGRRINIRKMQNCNEGSCWSESYNSCTFECTWRPPTPKPTPLPTLPPTVGIEESTHPIRITFNNVPKGFRLSNAVKGEILLYVTKILKDFLDESLELVDVSFVGSMSEAFAQNGGRKKRNLIRGQRRLEKLYYYLNVTVRGPSDISEFIVAYYVTKTFQDHMGDLLIHLKSLNIEVFQDLDASDLVTDSFDANELDFTSQPTPEPTPSPTPSPVVEEEIEIEPEPEPTPSPTLQAKEPTPVVDVKTEEESAVVGWWVWLIVVAVILLVIFCLIAVCMYRRKKEKKENEKYGIQQYFNATPVAKEPIKPVRLSHSHHNHHNKKHDGKPHEIQHSHKRPRPVRKRSMTEIEEEQRERALTVIKTEPRENSDAQVRKKRHSKRKHEKRRRARTNEEPHNNQSEQHELPDDCAATVDPPEEHALVLYSNNSDHSDISEPEVSALQETSYIGKYIDKTEPDYDEESCVQSQDPDGMKIPKKFSVYAEDVYSSAASSNGEEPGGRRQPKKDSLFICAPDQLPPRTSDVMQHIQESSSDREHQPESEEEHHHQNSEPHPKKKKKSSKKHGSKKSSTKKKSKRKSGAERVRRALSFTQEKPMDIDEGDDDEAIRQMEHPEEVQNESANEEYYQPPERLGEKPPSLFGSFSRKLSWRNE